MIWGGVVKSGSPTPRLMTSGIVAMTSKNLRMPDGGTAATRRARREADRTAGSTVMTARVYEPAGRSSSPAQRR